MALPRNEQDPQRFRGRTEASALTSCVISTLPPTCRLHHALFCQQLLDLTHRWWSETEGPTSRRGMSTPWRQRLVFALNCTPPGTLTRLHSSFQTLNTWPALTDLLAALAATVGRRQPRNVPPLHTAQAVHEVVVEEYRIPDSVNYELACSLCCPK